MLFMHEGWLSSPITYMKLSTKSENQSIYTYTNSITNASSELS